MTSPALPDGLQTLALCDGEWHHVSLSLVDGRAQLTAIDGRPVRGYQPKNRAKRGQS